MLSLSNSKQVIKGLQIEFSRFTFILFYFIVFIFEETKEIKAQLLVLALPDKVGVGHVAFILKH